MKTIFRVIVFAFSVLFFVSCTKTGEDMTVSKEQQVVDFLTGSGNKVWKLKKVVVNNVEQILTADQLKYTKTYTINPGQEASGTFANSDGIKGKWSLSGTALLVETILNNPAGPVVNSYLINEISDSVLDIEYTSNFITIREVYYAF